MSGESAAGRATLADVLRRAGVTYDHYKEKCIERRLAARMRARGAATYADYARLLQSDPGEARLLTEALTISVSRFFRNSLAFEALRNIVIPELWQRPDLEIRVWSAGCSGGEEAWSIAALFHEHAAAAGEVQRLSRVRILGTDVARESLATAERGRYNEALLAEAPPELRERYFRSSERDSVTVSPELRALVRFARHDLVLDSELPDRFHLIVCRNVLIYLERQAQESLLRRFHRCSFPRAFLMLGKVEAVIGRSREWFSPVMIRARIYRRVD